MHASCPIPSGLRNSCASGAMCLDPRTPEKQIIWDESFEIVSCLRLRQACRSELHLTLLYGCFFSLCTSDFGWSKRSSFGTQKSESSSGSAISIWFCSRSHSHVEYYSLRLKMNFSGI